MEEEDEFSEDQLSAWGDEDGQQYPQASIAAPLPDAKQNKRTKHLRSSKSHHTRSSKHIHSTRDRRREDASLTESKSTSSLLSVASAPLHFSMFRLADGVQPGRTRLAACASSGTILEPLVQPQSKHSSTSAYQAPTVVRQPKHPKRSLDTNTGGSTVVCRVVASTSPLSNDHLPRLQVPESSSEYTGTNIIFKEKELKAEAVWHLPTLDHHDESSCDVVVAATQMRKSKVVDAFASMLPRQLCKNDRVRLEIYRQSNQSGVSEWSRSRRRHPYDEIDDSASHGCHAHGEDTAEALVRTLTQFTRKEATKAFRAAD